VELFLNFAWLSVSLALVVFWARAARHTWSAFVALFLLLILLFPVISMTDDLVAMTAPFELEHPSRRDSTSLVHSQDMAAMLDAVALASLLLLGFGFVRSRICRLLPHSFSEMLQAGFVRAMGVRPPPTVLLAH
jgi:hypothetical protein